jgi:metallophosphoesterase (TIGR00282 family)
MNVLFIGDIVGKPGRVMVARAVPALIARWDLHLVIANAENAAGGSGLNEQCFEELTAAGVDVITMGDHVYKKKDIMPLFEKSGRILRPANFPAEAPGAELAIVPARDGTPVAVFTLLGRVFMRPVDCPFRAADRLLAALSGRARAVIVDMHAEATSDKQLMGRYLDGRASAVLGTHTHVATADEQIFPGGTGYISDVGMTGPYDSILGRHVGKVTETTVSFVPTFFDVATGDPRLCGARLQIDPDSGHTVAIERVVIREAEANALAEAAALAGQSTAAG